MSGHCPHCGEQAGHVEGCGDAWIACTDRLPDDDEAVLTCEEDGDVSAGYHDAGAWYTLDGIRRRYTVITHWRHMPAQPAIYTEDAA